MAWAFSIVPPASRYAVIPVARNVWQPIEEGRPAARARRLIISRTSVLLRGFSVSFRLLSTLRKRGLFFSARMPAASRYSSRMREPLSDELVYQLTEFSVLIEEEPAGAFVRLFAQVDRNLLKCRIALLARWPAGLHSRCGL